MKSGVPACIALDLLTGIAFGLSNPPVTIPSVAGLALVGLGIGALAGAIWAGIGGLLALRSPKPPEEDRTVETGPEIWPPPPSR